MYDVSVGPTWRFDTAASSNHDAYDDIAHDTKYLVCVTAV